MHKPGDVFDRDREWSQLTSFIEDERPGATFGVVSGRRRQGKTFLLEAACQQAGGFYFSAQEATEAESLSLISAALTRYLDPVAPISATDWPSVLDILLRIGRERPVPVVIDEFPYLARAAPALPSMMQGAFAPRRAERRDSRTRLLLCGSAISFMGRMLSGNAPLSRTSQPRPVRARFDYRLAAQFWELHDPRLAFLVHSVVGGTPAYRTEMIRYDSPHNLADFDSWVSRAILSPGSPMFLEARYLLAEEPDLRDGALYNSVLAAIAAGNAGRGGIASYVGRKTNELHHPLTVLEDAGLIVREADAFRANRTDFRINEPLLAFYHAVVRPYWPVLMRGIAADRIWENCQRRFASAILGPQFERLCREWTLDYAADRFGEWPTQVSAGTVNDPAGQENHPGRCRGDRAPRRRATAVADDRRVQVERGYGLRSPGAAAARPGPDHQEQPVDTRGTRLACFSGAGFSADLETAAGAGEVDLIGLDELYGVTGRA